MRRRIELHTSSERRRIRDIVQKADQLRRDSVFFEPGGSYSGGGGASEYGGYYPGGDNYFGHNDPPCVRVPEEAKFLDDNGDGTFSVPDGYELREAFFDGVNATGKYDITDGTLVPHGTLDPETTISGLMYPR